MSLCAVPHTSVWLLQAGGERQRPAPSHGACRSRQLTLRPLAARQVSASVPPPQPPPPSGARAPPPWAFAAGLVAVAAAAFKAASASRRSRAKQGAIAAPAAAKVAAAAAATPPSRRAQAAAASKAAVHAAGLHLAASNGRSARHAAESMGPLLLAAETAGLMDDTATMSLEQLQNLATELYLLIQQMEMQLQDMVAELAERLPVEYQAQLDELQQQMEELEEQLAELKGQEGKERQVLAAERQYSEVQWRVFEVVTVGAADKERRSLRSLLYNLANQRQLLRQVEQQEALRLRMRSVEQRIAALLGQDQQPAAAAAAAARGTAPARHSVQEWPEWAAAPSTPVASHAHAAATALQVEKHAAREAAAHGQLRLVSAGASIPQSAKAATGGEDAFFLSSRGQGAIGVADGVGGWAAQGVDPSLYPRALMAACEDVLEETWGHGQLGHQQRHGGGAALAPVAASLGQGEGDEPPVLQVLEQAYSRTREPGSSTAILGLMLPSGRLSVANLGDCELKVVRDGRLVFATQILEHQWNMPLQLSCASFYDCGSRPEDADVHEVEVAPGDIVVAGSDGLWDNLWDQQLLQAIEAAQHQAGSNAATLAQHLAVELAQEAHRQSLDPRFRSPFAVERQRRLADEIGGLAVADVGGKEDDVTVVVAVVSDGLL